jgi:hypothetical protein
MERLLVLLAETACRERVVASQRIANGMHLLAYPAPDGILVALGFASEQAHTTYIDVVLRRRAEHPERFAAWLPALFIDGSWYVARHVARDNASADTAALILPAEDLQRAQELLS